MFFRWITIKIFIYVTDLRTQSERFFEQSSTTASVKSENEVKNQSSLNSLVQEDTNLTEVPTSSSSKFCIKYLHHACVLLFKSSIHYDKNK